MGYSRVAAGILREACWWPRVEATPLAYPKVPPLAHTALATGTSRHSACGQGGGCALIGLGPPPLALIVSGLAIGILASPDADGQSGRTPSGKDRCVHSLQRR